MNLTYKYLPPERLSYLQDSLLRFTQPGDLNDPFECLPVLPSIIETTEALEILLINNIAKIKNEVSQKATRKDLIILEIRKIKAAITAVRKDSPYNWREKFNQESVLKMLSKIGIISFSKRWNSTLMWAHYASSHKGYCIGIDIDNSFFADYRANFKSDIVFQEVTYSNERLKIPYKSGETLDYNLMFTKSNEWEYEKEERLLLFLNRAKKIIKKEPYDICLFEVPHYLIKEIIVGANCCGSDFEIIKSFCTDNGITLFKSYISDTKFDMTRRLI